MPAPSSHQSRSESLKDLLVFFNQLPIYASQSSGSSSLSFSWLGMSLANLSRDEIGASDTVRLLRARSRVVSAHCWLTQSGNVELARGNILLVPLDLSAMGCQDQTCQGNCSWCGFCGHIAKVVERTPNTCNTTIRVGGSVTDDKVKGKLGPGKGRQEQKQREELTPRQEREDMISRKEEHDETQPVTIWSHADNWDDSDWWTNSWSTDLWDDPAMGTSGTTVGSAAICPTTF